MTTGKQLILICIMAIGASLGAKDLYVAYTRLDSSGSNLLDRCQEALPTVRRILANSVLAGSNGLRVMHTLNVSKAENEEMKSYTEKGFILTDVTAVRWDDVTEKLTCEATFRFDPKVPIGAIKNFVSMSDKEKKDQIGAMELFGWWAAIPRRRQYTIERSSGGAYVTIKN